MKLNIRILIPTLILLFTISASGCREEPDLKIYHVTAELNKGETADIELVNGEIVTLSLLDISVFRDSLRGAVRDVRVRVSVDGEEITIGSGNYHLPVTTGRVKIDCPVIKEFTVSSYYRHDGELPADARIRLWPKDSPYIGPGTFGFPLEQAWLVNRMQSQNELAGLGWAENLRSTNHGYHSTHDFGGAEGMDVILAATGGLVVSSSNEVLEGFEDLPGDVRPDVVWVVDGRNWYYRYSHLNSIEPDIVPGANIEMGQKLGYMGKQGGSGGWVHLHFGVHHKNPETGRWEVEDAWPFLWEAYVNEYDPQVVAVARPRQLLWTGQETALDGSKSVSLAGDIISWEWKLSDGTIASGPVQTMTYKVAGEYSEILKVTDSKGNVDYDFMNLQVFDRDNPENQVPTIHAVFHPTLGIRTGDPVTFLVRTFGSQTGEEVWDFGDGSPGVTVNSGVVQRQTQNEGRYAETVHSFATPGHYVVRVERTNEHGYTAMGHLHVVVNE